MSRIGLNAHATSKDFDKGKLLTFVQRTQPAWMLVMDGLQVCRDVKAVVPSCNVIHRAYPDEEIYKQLSPQDWVNQKIKEIGHADVWCYTVNEMGNGLILLKWLADVIEISAKVNLKVVIGNFSVGTPEASDWKSPEFIRLLKLLDKHRSTAVLGLHEYACAVITSGFLGGYPDNAGVAPIPANAGKGRSLIHPATWPSLMDARTMTKFHCGRFYFMLDVCESEGIKPPRVVLTEHGFDDVSDIKPWSMTLPKTSPWSTIRGWKSCMEVWNRWFKSLGWAYERAYFEQLIWADKNIYQGTVVEGQLIFCWGQSSDKWETFNMSQALELQELLASYAALQNTQPPAEPPPVSYPKLPAANDPRWKHVIAAPLGGNVNVRSAPDRNSTVLTQIVPAKEAYVITDESQGMWIPVKLKETGIIGWVSSDVVHFLDVPPEKPVEEEFPPLLLGITYEEAMTMAESYNVLAANKARDVEILQQISEVYLSMASRIKPAEEASE